MSNNNTTVVNINQEQNNTMNKLNNQQKKLNLNEIQEVSNNGCCKSCCNKCCKCCKYTSLGGVAVLMALYLANVAKNCKDLFVCYKLKNFADEIQPILDGYEIGNAIRSQEAVNEMTNKIYAAYQKHLAKNLRINLEKEDLATTFNLAVDLNEYLKDIRELADECKKLGNAAKPHIDNIVNTINDLSCSNNYASDIKESIDKISLNVKKIKEIATVAKDKKLKDKLEKAAKGFYLGDGYDSVLNSSEGIGNIIYEGNNCIAYDGDNCCKKWCNRITKLLTGWTPFPNNNSKNKYSLVGAFGKDKLKIE